DVEVAADQPRVLRVGADSPGNGLDDGEGRLLIGEIDELADAPPRRGTVHRPGVEVGHAEFLGEPARDRGFTRAGRAIDSYGRHFATTRQPRFLSSVSSSSATAGSTEACAIQTFCYRECSIEKSSIFAPVSPTSLHKL